VDIWWLMWRKLVRRYMHISRASGRRFTILSQGDGSQTAPEDCLGNPVAR